MILTNFCDFDSDKELILKLFEFISFDQNLKNQCILSNVKDFGKIGDLNSFFEIRNLKEVCSNLSSDFNLINEIVDLLNKNNIFFTFEFNNLKDDFEKLKLLNDLNFVRVKILLNENSNFEDVKIVLDLLQNLQIPSYFKCVSKDKKIIYLLQEIQLFLNNFNYKNTTPSHFFQNYITSAIEGVEKTKLCPFMNSNTCVQVDVLDEFVCVSGCGICSADSFSHMTQKKLFELENYSDRLFNLIVGDIKRYFDSGKVFNKNKKGVGCQTCDRAEMQHFYGGNKFRVFGNEIKNFDINLVEL